MSIGRKVKHEKDMKCYDCSLCVLLQPRRRRRPLLWSPPGTEWLTLGSGCCLSNCHPRCSATSSLWKVKEELWRRERCWGELIFAANFLMDSFKNRFCKVSQPICGFTSFNELANRIITRQKLIVKYQIQICTIYDKRWDRHFTNTKS